MTAATAGDGMRWFSDCRTVAEVKVCYRELAFQHHPDRGGATVTMQDINAAYHAMLQGMHGQQTEGDDGITRAYWYHAGREAGAVEVLDKLIALRMADVDIWLIGTWVWAAGNTRPYRGPLKATGLRWHSKRAAWYWAPPGRRSRYNARASLADLADTYGAEHFAAEQAERESLIAGGAA